MSNRLKAIFIAFIAITIMFGCKGPPRPGWHPRRHAPATQQQTQTQTQTANEKAQNAAEKAQEKLDSE